MVSFFSFLSHLPQCHSATVPQCQGARVPGCGGLTQGLALGKHNDGVAIPPVPGPGPAPAPARGLALPSCTGRAAQSTGRGLHALLFWHLLGISRGS